MNESSIPNSCPECGSLVCHEGIEDFEVGMPDGSVLVVPQIAVWRCYHCGARWLGPISSDLVDEIVRRGARWRSSV